MKISENNFYNKIYILNIIKGKKKRRRKEKKEKGGKIFGVFSTINSQ